MIEGIIGGILLGAAYGIVGYAKNKDDYTEFDWKQFGSTILGTAIVGGYAQYSGIALDVASASAIGLVITQTTKKVVGIIFDKLQDRGII